MKERKNLLFITKHKFTRVFTTHFNIIFGVSSSPLGGMGTPYSISKWIGNDIKTTICNVIFILSKYICAVYIGDIRSFVYWLWYVINDYCLQKKIHVDHLFF